MSVGLSDAQVDESGHWQTHIEPVTEAEVVDELEHVLHAQEDQTHQPLQTTQNNEKLVNTLPEHLRVPVHCSFVDMWRIWGCITETF